MTTAEEPHHRSGQDGEILGWMPAEQRVRLEAAGDTILRGCRDQHCVFLVPPLGYALV
jgi:hypothetical protein